LGILIVAMVEHLGVAPADQESLKLKDKLVKKGSQTLKGGESLSRYHSHRGYQLAKLFNEINECRASRRRACALCHMDRSHRRCEVLARSAFISRREGRYIFAIRTPACLKSVYRSGSIRLALGTANYQMASTRAALIASWFLRIRTMDADPRKAMVELWPRLQALAREPVRNEDDYIERRAFQGIAFDVQFLVRHSGAKPDEIVAGWDEHFVMLIRENGRAGHIIEKNNSLAGRVERRREELFAQGADLVVSPSGANSSPAVINPAAVAAAVSAAMPPDGNRSRLSEVLKKFLDWREGEDGDRRAANDVAPIIQFAIDLWKDPCIGDIGPDQLILLKKAMPEIPTPAGFLVGVRSLHQRWTIAKANDYVVETDGKKVKLVRVSASTLRKRYRSGLNTFWAFLIENLYVLGPAPDFSSTSKHNPPAIERDAFEEEELLKFLSTPLFTGCAGISRVWNVGGYFCQTYFYWAILIQLLCGLRPGEISQLRCADIAALYREWHFRFAKRSLAEDDDDEDREEEMDTEPGGNDAKTKNAFRWVPIHPLLDSLGIIARRDAIVADYITRKFSELGGERNLSKAQRDAVEDEAATMVVSGLEGLHSSLWTSQMVPSRLKSLAVCEGEIQTAAERARTVQRTPHIQRVY
jgi:integrase